VACAGEFAGDAEVKEQYGELWVWLFGIVLLLGGVFAYSHLTRNRLTEGTIIAKEHHNPSSHVTVNPVVGGKTTQFVVSSQADPERWVFVMEGEHEGERRIERWDADRYDWEKASVGSHRNLSK